MNTVTARFEGTAVDETAFADAVSDAAGARSHPARQKPEDVMQEARDIVWHQDEPYGSTSIHAQWHVFAAARANGLKVMLDGQGADEIMSGYQWYNDDPSIATTSDAVNNGSFYVDSAIIYNGRPGDGHTYVLLDFIFNL